MKKNLLILTLALASACTFATPSYALLKLGRVTKNNDIPTPVQEQDLTLGIVQRDVKVGMSQDEVAVALGSPNIVTKDSDGKDTWIYDKVSSISSYGGKDHYATIILAGTSGGKGSVQNVQKTLTVVIKFDKKNRVESFTYHMSKF